MLTGKDGREEGDLERSGAGRQKRNGLLEGSGGRHLFHPLNCILESHKGRQKRKGLPFGERDSERGGEGSRDVLVRPGLRECKEERQEELEESFASHADGRGLAFDSLGSGNFFFCDSEERIPAGIHSSI